MMTLDQLAEQTARLWEQAQEPSADKYRKATRLLRLAIIRELVRQIHTQRSELLARGRLAEATELEYRETFFNYRFLEVRFEEARFREVFLASGRKTKPLTISATPLELPSGLAAAVPPEKLNRHDRKLEAEMAREALKQSWNFWTLDAWVEVQKVESWAKSLEQKLWPYGVVLFVESDGFLKSFPVDGKSRAFWHGRWTIILTPRVKDPTQDLTMDFENWCAIPSDWPSWKLLYKPDNSA
jgi:hypothetical protein